MRTEIVLGDRVQCRITDFEGVAVARTDWIYGCIRWGVQREQLTDKEGTPTEPQWFDDEQLFVVLAGAVERPVAESDASKNPRMEVLEVHHHHTRTASGGPSRPGEGTPARGQDDCVETG